MELSRKERIQVGFRVLKLVHEENHSLIPLVILQSVVNLISKFLPIILIAPILDGLFNKDFQRAVFYGTLLFTLEGICGLLGDYIEKTRAKMAKRTSKTIEAKLHLHPLALDFESMQDSSVRSEFETALQSLNYEGDFSEFVFLSLNVLSALLEIITSLSLVVIMISANPVKGSPWVKTIANPWVSTLIVTGVMVLYSGILSEFLKAYNRKMFQYFKEHINMEKRFAYFCNEVIYAYPKHKMMHIYNMNDMIIDNVKESNRDICKFYNYNGNLIVKKSVFQSLSSGLILVLSYFIVGVKVLTGAVGLNTFVSYSQSLTTFNQSLINLVYNYNNIMQMIPYFNEMLKFMDKKNKFETGTIPIEKRHDNEVELEFHNVSFKYPGSDKWALRNVSCKIDMKKKHAIVGPNGAGKTTFILLLCRLYEPTEGLITLNGVDIRKYDYEEYLSLFSVVFQDYSLFAFTLGENVACSENIDEKKAIEKLTQAGLKEKLKTLELGLNTPLFHYEEKGQMFSGGEEQKVAIARALYKKGYVVILDEPTAALDPMSEADIYEHLNDLIQDKTTLFISHRMSSCRFCSDIIVFNNGQIVERGSHEELLKLDGLYAQMWNSQAKYYKEDLKLA